MKLKDARFFFYLYSHKIFFWLFFVFFLFQIQFWRHTENIKISYDIVPPAPNKYFISAASLGDKEFLFRSLAARLQNSGDVFAGFVALKNYDYSRIYAWLKSLDTLNSRSNFSPALAAYIYSQTQNKKDNAYIVDYLDQHAMADLDNKWWWLFQAIYIAKEELKDNSRALDLAYKISQNNSDQAPLWTKQMPAFIYAEMGDGCLAFQIIEKMLSESESGVRKVSPDELNFMRFFIKDRLKKLKNGRFDPRNCK